MCFLALLSVSVSRLFVVSTQRDAWRPAPGNNRHGENTDLFACALDDFQARSSDELSLAKGDRVELIERDDEFGDGWFLGKHLVNGNSGLFPEGLFASSLGRVATD